MPISKDDLLEAARASAPPRALRVAVVGCGAVSKANLLPVLAGHDGLTIAALVDRDEARARELASAYGVGRVATDMAAVMDDVDAVVLATPPAHHAPATIDLAARGKHVLVEKPMAVTLADARAMVEACDRHHVALAVGLYRRMLPSVRLLRALLESGQYGRPLSVDAEEGGPYGWQLATLDGLTRAAGGGGVLIDIGSHVIDVLLFVLPGTPVLSAFEDNSRGGIETDGIARFGVRVGAAEIPVRLELSRTRELRGSIRVECEHATLELLRGDFERVLVHRHDAAGTDAPIRLSAEWAGQQPFVGYQAFRDEIDDWVSAIAAGTSPALSGESVLPVVGLIEECYRTRQRLAEPWVDEGLRAASSRPKGVKRHRVLVTGAGGFRGNRTVELLRARYDCEVVALVREPKSAARLARWPGDIVVGDVCSAADMARAVRGCDTVVHCAVGTIWPPDAARRVTVEGTRVAAEAARHAGVRRFVHISTLFVHRRDGIDVIDETTPLAPPAGDDYGQAKLAAEQALAGVAQTGLSTIVLRPVRIYGPFSRTFTIRPLQTLADGTFGLRGNPDVPANMVYVDNVVEAIARAVVAPDNAAGAFLVSDAEQATLREFYELYATLAGRPLRILDTEAEPEPARPGLTGRWIGAARTIATSPQLRAIVRKVLDTDPIGTLPRKLWDLSPAMQQKLLKRFGSDPAVIYRPALAGAAETVLYYGEAAHVSIARAQTDLGYEPPVDRARATALTVAWARAARLLPASRP
jgi:predicted dehydrogenase/nucleoside-diphosphate-sugar epimerase